MKILAILVALIATNSNARTVQCYDRHDTVILTMKGTEDRVETLNVVYKDIDLGTYTNDRLKTDAYDDVELEISETINYGDLYLWMAWGKIKWFTWARSDGMAFRFRGKTYCHDIEDES